MTDNIDNHYRNVHPHPSPSRGPGNIWMVLLELSHLRREFGIEPLWCFCSLPCNDTMTHWGHSMHLDLSSGDGPMKIPMLRPHVNSRVPTMAPQNIKAADSCRFQGCHSAQNAWCFVNVTLPTSNICKSTKQPEKAVNIWGFKMAEKMLWPNILSGLQCPFHFSALILQVSSQLLQTLFSNQFEVDLTFSFSQL